jgi:hypothetical protein
MKKRKATRLSISDIVLCPKCITKFPLLMLDKHVKGICQQCQSNNSYTVKYKPIVNGLC